MKRVLFLLFTIAFVATTYGQESNNGKRLWAKSVLNEPAPKLIVEQWLTQKPNTEGKFVLIDFWATWCGPCRAFIPKLNKISQKFKDELIVIGISDETKEQVENLKGTKPIYFEAIDTKKRMSNELEVKGIPHVILIDPKGIVRWEGFPLLDGHELSENVIATLIEKYK